MAKALAMATRCCSPPESWAGYSSSSAGLGEFDAVGGVAARCFSLVQAVSRFTPFGAAGDVLASARVRCGGKD